MAEIKRPTEERQLKFFSALVANGGNFPAAAEVSNYSKEYGYELGRKYKDYLIEQIEGHLAIIGLKASHRVAEAMDDDGTIANSHIRLKAALEVLDRIGIVKEDRMKVDIESEKGIFILPQKNTPSDE